MPTYAEVRRKITEAVAEDFKKYLLPKRFNYEYAVYTLHYRHREVSYYRKGTIAVKTGQTRRQAFETFKIEPTGFSFSVPPYTAIKSWKMLPGLGRYSKDNIASIIYKNWQLFEGLTNYRRVYKLVAGLIGTAHINVISRIATTIVNYNGESQWFNCEKSVYEELSTVFDSEFESLKRHF